MHPWDVVVDEDIAVAADIAAVGSASKIAVVAAVEVATDTRSALI